MSAICLQGAAQGVWKEIARRVVGGREAEWAAKSEAEVISLI